MNNETLQVAARLGAIETVELVDGYDRSKHPRKILFRRFTMDDIRLIRSQGNSEYWFESNQGQARRCRRNGAMKSWSRNPDRFEQSFKYGMYESFRMDTQDMLNRLLVEI